MSSNIPLNPGDVRSNMGPDSVNATLEGSFTSRCVACGLAEDLLPRCSSCSGELAFLYPPDRTRPDSDYAGMWRYHRWLPVRSPERAVTLGEGSTPLLRARASSSGPLFFKDESRNPTGSQKDRALSVALTRAREDGKTSAVVVSSGSTGISNAAYSAAAGIVSFTVVPSSTPWQRTLACELLGSTVIRVDAGVDELVDRVAALSADGVIHATTTARSTNPFQAEASKTIAAEIIEQLGAVPDWVIVPAGGGGTLSGMWTGFSEIARERDESPPRLLATVAAAYDALARSFEGEGQESPSVPESRPVTLLSKLAHTHPPDGMEALAAIRASRGAVFGVTDHEALDAQSRLAREEGLFVEPSSATAMVGLRRALDTGLIREGETVVVVLTGSGHRETFHHSGPAQPSSPIEFGSLRDELLRHVEN